MAHSPLQFANHDEWAAENIGRHALAKLFSEHVLCMVTDKSAEESSTQSEDVSGGTEHVG